MAKLAAALLKPQRSAIVHGGGLDVSVFEEEAEVFDGYTLARWQFPGVTALY